MRRILNLLISTTIIFGTIPNLLANSSYTFATNNRKQIDKQGLEYEARPLYLDGLITFQLDGNQKLNYTKLLNESIELGEINENKREAILQAIKQKYPRAKISELEVEIPENNYNVSNNTFWAHLKVKKTSIVYPQNLLNKKVIFKIKDHNIKKRTAPKSLLELASTVNIGDIECFDIDEEHIRNRLVTLNHSIFSRSDFLDAFVFDNIGQTSARGHLRDNIRVGERITDVIPDNLDFIINYNPVVTLSRVIPNRNLGTLENNFSHTILSQLQEDNPLITQLQLHLRISDINQITARIYIVNSTVLYNGREFNIDNTESPIEVNFRTDNFTLSSLATNTNLGELPNNNAKTIKLAFLRHNLHIKESDIKFIDQITDNSAVIVGNLDKVYHAPTIHFSDDTWLPIASDDARILTGGTILYNLFSDRIIVSFTLKKTSLLNKFKKWLTRNEKPNANGKWTTLINNLPKDYSNNDLDNILGYTALSKEKKQEIWNKINQQFGLTTVDIGNIEINDKEHILNSAYLLNHPIFSDPNFKQNFIFDKITKDTATGHLLNNIFSKEEFLDDFITNKTTFTFKFNTNQRIINNINLNWKVIGPITDDTKVWRNTINLIKWSDYANTWQEFRKKYKHIKINNINSSAGGQGTTISNTRTNIKFNTENINQYLNSDKNNLSLLEYSYCIFMPLFYVEQKAMLYIKNLWFEGEYLKIQIVSYTFSFLALYHVWSNLKIDKVEVY